MRQPDANYTQKYRAKRKTTRYAFDLYLDDPEELALAKMLDQAKADKQLKTVIKDALQTSGSLNLSKKKFEE